MKKLKCLSRILVISGSFAMMVNSTLAGNLLVTLSSGTLTQTYTDGGNGYVDITGMFNNWFLPAGIVVTSQPYVGNSVSNYVNIHIGYLENQGASSPLVITATETNFGPNPTANALNLTLAYSDVSGTMTGMINGTTMGSLGPVSGTESLPVSGPTSTFSMTDILVLSSDNPPAAGSIDAGLSLVPVPEPSTTVLMGLGLAGLLAIKTRRFQRAPCLATIASANGATRRRTHGDINV